EQLVFVLEGRIRLNIFDQPDGGSRSVEMGVGDMIVLPPNVPHSGETLEDARVLDAFNPPRTTVLGEPEEGSDDPD
ncbi:MAG: cupin domain-containing protein, partial [Pseudomonadota bacterium]